MGQLFGNFKSISIDEKGRFSIPANLRKAISDAAENTFVIVRGTEGCLFAYPSDEWINFWENGLKKLPVTRENTFLIRRIMGSLKESVIDGQGRVTLSQELRELSGITGDITVVGKGEKLEVWDTATWEKRMTEAETTSYDEAYYKAMENYNALKDANRAADGR